VPDAPEEIEPEIDAATIQKFLVAKNIIECATNAAHHPGNRRFPRNGFSIQGTYGSLDSLEWFSPYTNPNQSIYKTPLSIAVGK
jgi:hypothetical protein